MLDVVAELVSQTPRGAYKSGVDACYMPIDKRWGFKFYYNRDTRDKAVTCQKIGCEIGYAPMVGDTFEMTLPTGSYVYGYITENALETVIDRDHSIYGISGVEANFPNQIQEIHDGFMARGWKPNDLHSANVAWMDETEDYLVVIDFGHFREVSEGFNGDLDDESEDSWGEPASDWSDQSCQCSICHPPDSSPYSVPGEDDDF